MMMNQRKAMAAIAGLVVVLLCAFGIDQIGGATWVAAVANAEAGWHAGVGAYAPPPTEVLHTIFLPAVLVLGVLGLAILGAVLKRHSNRDAEEVTTPTAR